MSNVVSPKGPLPRRVYWRRRLLLLLVVAGVLLLVVRALGVGDDDTAPAADRERTAAEPRSPATATDADRARTTPQRRAPAADETGRDRDGAQGVRDRDRRDSDSARADDRESSPEAPPVTSTLAAPAGGCDPSDVVVVPDVDDTDAQASVPLRLGVSATGGSACTFEVAPDNVALQITSGDDMIWQSATCERAIAEQDVTVRPGWLSYVTLEWSGRRGDDGCGDRNSFADPGYYWAEAAAIGGEPHRAQFQLETPPPPKPAEKPGEDPDDQSGDGSDGRPGEGPDSGAQEESQEEPRNERGDRAGQEAGTAGRSGPVDSSRVG